jgi:hypothetical protein
VWQESPGTAALDDVEDGVKDMASRTSCRGWILGHPVALGAGRRGSRQPHSASDRSVWYAFLMLGILPSEFLRTPFQTVSLRSSPKFRGTLCTS